MSQPSRRSSRLGIVGMVLLALGGLALCGSGCAGEPEVPGEYAFEASPPPALQGIAGELTAAIGSARPAVVRLRSEAELLRPGDDYLVGLLDGFLSLLNPNPYYEWPYRVIRFPLYLMFGAFSFGEESVGSGFFVTPTRVVTNAHVVANSARVLVELTDGRRAEARVERVDPVLDLALLELPEVEGERPHVLALRRHRALLGEPVVALGYPPREVLVDRIVGAPLTSEREHLPNTTATVGIVAATDVELGNPRTRFVETDAALNPGNSGGPLIGLDGAVVGVTTMIGVGKANEGYAVPAETLMRFCGDVLAE